MLYVIDAFSTPPVVVHIVDDDDIAASTAQRYAEQVHHSIIVIEGPAPAEAQFHPTIPLPPP